MTTLAGTATYPDGTPASYGKVTVRLVASVDGLAPGYDGNRGIYGLSHAKVASDGTWRVEGLTPNDDPALVPAGTVYEVLVQVPGRPVAVAHARLTTAGGGVQQLRDVLTLAPVALPEPHTHPEVAAGAHPDLAAHDTLGLVTQVELNKVAPLYPSGDTTGVTDAANIEAALAALPGGFGTVVLGAGVWYIDRRITVGQGQNLWGQGNGQGHAATRIYCTTAGAGIAFGTRTTGGRGGVSGNFTVNGKTGPAGIKTATQPLFLGLVVQRVFIGLESHNSAGDGFVLEATQNCTFVGCQVDFASLVGLVFDYGAAANRFYNFESDTNGTWSIVFRQSGASPPGAVVAGPYENHLYGGICERGVTVGCVLQTGGADGNGIHDFEVVAPTPPNPAFDLVRVESGAFNVDGGVLQGAVTALKVRNGATIIVSGEPTCVSSNVKIDNQGTVSINGFLRDVGTIGTHLIGTAPRKPATDAEVGAHTTATTTAHGGLVAATDSRLADQRVPLDGSVTNAKVAPGAGIDPAKIAGTAVVQDDLTGRLAKVFVAPAFGALVSHVNWTTFSQSGTSYFGGRNTSTGTQNAEAVYAVPSLAAGAWTLVLLHSAFSNRGIYTIATSVDGAQWTTHGTIDGYLATSAQTRSELGGLVLPLGTNQLRLTMATKNASSSGFFGAIDGVIGHRTAA